jgi:hypothetical protein
MTAPLRHHCRNPRCRMKLAEPADNERRAFCTPACHTSFYRRRCVVCEKELHPGPANRKLCKNATCQREYRRFPHVYQLGNVQQPLETPIKSGPETRLVTGQASATALRLASPPLDQATATRVARGNAKWKKDPKALFQRHTPPLNLIGGHRFADVPKLKADLRQAIVATERTLMLEPVKDVPHNSSSLPWTESFLLGLARAIADSEAPSIVPDEKGADVHLVADDDLAIPEFLRRAITKETTSAAIVRTPEDVCPTRA